MQQASKIVSIYEKMICCNGKLFRNAALQYYGRNVACRGILTQVERCARAFLRWEIKPGDAVLLCTTAVPELVYAVLALWKLGAVPHLLDPLLLKGHMTQWVKKSGASLILVLDQLFPCIDSALDEDELLRRIVIPMNQSMPLLARRNEEAKRSLSLIDINAPRLMLWKEFMESGHSICTSPVASLLPEQAAAVFYMTEENEIRITQGDICRRMDWYRKSEYSLKSGERFLTMVPPWYPMGLLYSIMVPLCLGLKVILEPRLDTDVLASNLIQEKPQHVAASGRNWGTVLKQPQLAGANISFLRGAYAGSAGEALSQEEKKDLDVFFSQHHSYARLQEKTLAYDAGDYFFQNMVQRT
jgi:long-chain acyl-CoA synthetase